MTQISLKRDSTHAQRLQLGCKLCGRILIRTPIHLPIIGMPIGEGEVHALRGQCLTNGCADANAAAVDVLAPCALGGVLNEDTVPQLRCRMIAGAANNQLATEADGERLAERGILWVPDFVTNAGECAPSSTNCAHPVCIA